MEDLQARLDESAYRRGAHEMASGLFELVDECEQALKALMDLDDPEGVQLGLEGMRGKLLRHFERMGYRSVDPLGEDFDPHLHEALAVEAGPGRDGAVVKVHRRGWFYEETIVVPAQVTVRQGELTADADVPARRRRAPWRKEGEL